MNLIKESIICTLHQTTKYEYTQQVHLFSRHRTNQISRSLLLKVINQKSTLSCVLACINISSKSPKEEANNVCNLIPASRKSGQLRGEKGCASKQTDHPLSSVHILTRYFRSLSMTGPADRESRDENWCTSLTMHTTLDMPHILRKKIIIPSFPSWCCLSPRMIIANSSTRLHSNINTARDVHNNNNTYDSCEFAATFAGHWKPEKPWRTRRTIFSNTIGKYQSQQQTKQNGMYFVLC